MSATQKRSITVLRAQIVALDAVIKEMEKAEKPYGKTKKERAQWHDDDRRQTAVGIAWEEMCDSLIVMKPSSDAEILAVFATLEEREVPDYYVQCGYKLDERDQALVNLRAAVARRLAA